MPTSTSTSNVHPNLNPTYNLDPPNPQQIKYLRCHMTNILHALSSTFTTCACGARAKDYVLMQMAHSSTLRMNTYRLIHVHWLTAICNGQPNGVKGDWQEKDWREVDMGPFVGRKQGAEDEGAYPV